jgi:predicted PurR-regulated permease PerM
MVNQGKGTTQLNNAINFICFTFLTCFIIIPSVYLQTEGNLNNIGKINDELMRTPYQKTVISFLNTAFTETDLLSDIEINHSINDSFRVIRQLTERNFYGLIIPIVSFGIIICYLKFFIRETDKRRPLLASYLGGHAPPEKMNL